MKRYATLSPIKENIILPVHKSSFENKRYIHKEMLLKKKTKNKHNVFQWADFQLQLQKKYWIFFFPSYLAVFIFWNSDENNLDTNPVLQNQTPGMAVKRNFEVNVSLWVQFCCKLHGKSIWVGETGLRAASVCILQKKKKQKNQKQEELFQCSKGDRQKEKSSLLTQIIHSGEHVLEFGTKTKESWHEDIMQGGTRTAMNGTIVWLL